MSDTVGSMLLAVAAATIGAAVGRTRKFTADLANAVDLTSKAQQVGDTKVWDTLLELKKSRAQLAIYVTWRKCG